MRSEESSELEGLERFQSPGKGRGLRALRRFAVGELLFSCPAFTCVLTVNERGNHCECCFARYHRPVVEGEGREEEAEQGAGFALAAAAGFPWVLAPTQLYSCKRQGDFRVAGERTRGGGQNAGLEALLRPRLLPEPRFLGMRRGPKELPFPPPTTDIAAPRAREPESTRD